MLGCALGALLAGCGSNGDSAGGTTQASSQPPTQRTTGLSSGGKFKCPLTASEVSDFVGSEVQPVDVSTQGGDASTGCRFAASEAGSGEIQEPDVSVARTSKPLKELKSFYEKPPSDVVTDAARVVDRPDLGEGAFVLKVPSKRGATAYFPAAGGRPYAVLIALGFTDESSDTDTSSQDDEAVNQIIKTVKSRLGT